MGKQWARQEAKKNEMLAWLELAWEWVKTRRQAAIWGMLGALGVAILIAAMVYRHLEGREKAWSELAIAQSYSYYGQLETSLSQLDKLSSEQPRSLAAGYGLILAGDILYQQEKYREAAGRYQQVLDNFHHESLTPLALADLGMAQEAAGDFKAASASSERFLETYQDHFLAPQVHASLARAYLALGQPDKAKATYQRMALLYPETQWAQWAKQKLQG